MANEIYHRSNWGNAVNDKYWADVYEKYSATNKMYVRSDYYENSNETDKLMADIYPKPSILLTPTAYDNGSLHSVKPVKTFGSELVINGTFDTDSDWNKTGTWSISNGQASGDANSNTQYLGQNANIVIGKKYKISYTILSNTLSDNRLIISGTSAFATTQIPSNLGENSIILDATLVPFSGYSLRFAISATNASGSITIDNVSVKEVTEADFDFTRGSSATRVNEKGLIEDVQILSGNLVQNGDFSEEGSELITNGGFDTDSNWSKGTGWSISNGLAVSSESAQSISQVFNIEEGKTYKVSFEIKNYQSGKVKAQFGGGTPAQGIFNSSNGVYTEYFTALQGNNRLNFKGQGSDVFTGSIDNVSVKEVGQNWTVTNGNISDKYNASMTAYQSGIKITPFVKTGTYKVVFDLVVTSGSCKFDAGGGNDEIYTTSGTKEILITNPIKFEFNAFNLGWVGSLDNVSVIEITDDTDLPRINYTNFDYEDVLGDELVTNGYYEQSGIGNVISQSGGVLVNENNQLKISSNGSSAYSRGVWATGGLEGDTFLVEADIISTSGSVRFYDQSNNGTYTDLVVGSRYQRYIVLGSNDKNLGFGGNNDVNFELVLDNVSIKKFTGNVVVPYSGTGSLLLEPQSTNLVTYSEDFSQYTASVVTLESGYLAPDGSNNAYKASGTIGTSALYIGGALPTATRTIYAKTVSGTGQAHLCSFNANTNNLFTITEDWQRFEVNGTTINAGETNFYAVDFRGSTNLSEVIIWGGQVEELSYATSYIVSNSGSTTTRLADVCNNAGSSDLINSTEGVLYAEISALADDGTKRYISLSDGSNSNDVRLYFDTGGYISALTKVGGSTQAFLQTNAYTQTDFNKIAFKYKENNFSLYVNGIEVATDNLGSVNTANTLNQLAFFGNLLPFYGNVKTVAVFDYLDNDQLERLTGEGYESFNLLAQANNYTII